MSDFSFPNATAWLQNHVALVRSGERPIPPQTRDEMLLAEREGLLAVYPQWRPTAQGLRLLELPEFFGQEIEPWDEQWRSRFLVTMQEHPAFCASVNHLLKGGTNGD